MGYTVERHEFSQFSSDATISGGSMGLAQSIMSDLAQAGGMKLVYPSAGTISSTTKVAVFESDTTMDPLASRGEKWRLRIEAADYSGNSYIRINMGTHHQIPSDGTTVTRESEFATSGNLAGPTSFDTASGRTIRMDGSSISKEPAFLSEEFFYGDEDTDQAASPMSYRLSVSDHGVALCVWRNAYDNAGNKFAWFVVQRPVDPADGSVLSDYYGPVFCVYSVGGGGESTNVRISGQYVDLPDPNGIKRFIVRETDVFAPTKSMSAVVAQQDANPIMNPVEQVSISVDNKYMITFPSGLNTQRRAYKHELDMIAYTSADVISQDSDVNVTVFGETAPRTYKAMQANRPFNTGMRILLLTQGAGIPAPTESTPA